MIPTARRVIGDCNDHTLTMRKIYGVALYRAEGATLDDLRESVETLEDAERIAQRALGGAHPLTKEIEGFLQQARFVLRGYSLLPYGASVLVVAVIAWVWRRFLT